MNAPKAALALALAPQREWEREPDGRPLPPVLRRPLEHSFRRDLSGVRLHDDEQAATFAGRHQSRAVTSGSDIYFAADSYRPNTETGRVLVAHEVAHTVQQQTKGEPLPEAPLEQEADRAAAAAVAGRAATVSGAAPRGGLQHQRHDPPAEPVAPVLATGTMLSLALDRLADLRPHAPALQILERELQRLQGLPIDAQQEQLHARAERLLEVLGTAAPAIISLAELRHEDRFIPGVAHAIVAEATRLTGLYAAAIVMSFAEHEPDPPPIESAERAMTAFPDFISDQYLGRRGIPALIHDVGRQWERVQACRFITHRAVNSRRLDILLGVGDPRKLITAELNLALRDAIEARERHRPDAFQQITTLTAATQMVLAAVSALSFYEQFSVWEQQLGEHYVIDLYDSRLPEARRWRARFEAIVVQFETYSAATSVEGRQAVVSTAMESLQRVTGDPGLNTSWQRIQDRLQTIAIIDTIATVALITAAAALTGGAAAAALEPALVLGGASAGVAAGGAFVAEVLVFTAVSRSGQTLAFGGTQDDWSHDLFWNAVTLGAVKGVGLAFARAMQTAEGARAIMIGVGRAATTGLVLHGVAEIQAAARPGGGMGSEERYRAVIQNVLMLAGFELGRFLMEPMQNRIGGAIGARFSEAFRDQLDSLNTERNALNTQLEQMHRATATADDVNGLLDRIGRIMQREMTLLDTATRRGIMTQAQVEQALGGYRAAVSRLELRFAQLGILAPTGERAPLFRPIARGVVAFGPEGRALIDNLYSGQGASLRELPEGVLRGQSASGEVTYYLPEGRTSARLPSYQAAAAGHDAAEVAAQADDVAAEGLRRLRDPRQGFSVLNVSAILAEVPVGAMTDFLRAMADPRFERSLSADFMQFLARNPVALEFALRGGPRVMRNILDKAGAAGWRSVVDRADALLDDVPGTAPQNQILDRLWNARDLRAIEDVLGTPRPPRPPRPPRAFTGARRADPAWAGYLEQARQFGTDHGEHLTTDQLDLRATMLQLLADARAQRFRTASQAARVQALDAYDDLGRRSGARTTWINQGRGDLNEWLFSPSRGRTRSYFLNGVDQGRNVSGVTIPDYSLPTGETRPDGQQLVEWVELKSDLIDRGTQQGRSGPFQSGVNAARNYLRDGRADMPNLPRGDRMSIDFVRDPGAVTRRAMLAILLGPGSPYTRVKFGSTWYTRADVR